MKVRLKHQKLAEVVAASRMSQNRWAQRIGVSTGHLSELVNAKRPFPSARTRRRLLESTELEFKDLFEIFEEPVLRAEQHLHAGAVPLVDVQRGGLRIRVERVEGLPTRRRGNILHHLLSDCWYGLRLLKRQPLFTSIAVLALALGIGGNIAIFSVIDAVLLRPLPYENPGKLALVFSVDPDDGDDFGSVSPPLFREWREHSRSFQDLAAFHRVTHNLSGEDGTTRIAAGRVSAGFFELLGARPVLGRTFLPEDDAEGAEPVVILSHSFWTQRMGSDPNVIGKTLALSDRSLEIIGVLPRGFAFPVDTSDAEVWTTLALNGADLNNNWGMGFLNVVGRLDKDVSETQAKADIEALNRRMLEDDNLDDLIAANLLGLTESVVGPFEPALVVLLIAVAGVLLIACANVANLLIVRGTTRRSELAVRSALGAARPRLVRQLLTESALLGLLGGLLGIGLAWASIPLLLRIVPAEFPLLNQIQLDWRVLSFAFAVSFLSTAFFGMLSALPGSRLNLQSSLAGAVRTTGAGSTSRLRSGLVVAEVALTLVLLVGSGLLVRSFYELTQVDPGFTAKGLLTFRVAKQIADDTITDRQAQYYDDISDGLSGLPGIEAVSGATTLPLTSSNMGLEFSILDRAHADPEDRHGTRYASVMPGYFEIMGTPLLQGRTIQADDRRGRPGAVVINETMARQFWPQGDALGSQITISARFGQDGEPTQFEVVGIVGDVRQSALDTIPRPEMFVSYRQHTWPFMNFVARSPGGLDAFAGGVRTVMRGVDPTQAPWGIIRMEDNLEASLAGYRLPLILMGLFAGLATVLSAIGIYGVIAYTVTQRTQEFAIRMTLGANRPLVMAMVLRSVLGLVGLGLVFGWLGAVFASRMLSSLLFEMSPFDWMTYAATGALLAVISVLATLIPARRATRVNPMTALRAQ